MTIPTERTRAVQYARDFLRRLLSRQATPRVPQAVRDEAHRVLRHFPSDWDLHVAAGAAPASWADPEPAETHGLATDTPDTYLLKLTPKQAQVLAAACNLYSRIGIGQFEEIDQLARLGMLRQRSGDDDSESRYAQLEQARTALETAKRHIMGMEANASYGIRNDKVHEEFKIAWDLQQVIRHRLAWDQRGSPARRDWTGTGTPGSSMMGVNYDTPLASSGLPLARMERSSDADLMEDLPVGYALARSGYGDDQEWHLLNMQPTKTKPKADVTRAEVKWLGSGESVRSMLALAQNIEAREARAEAPSPPNPIHGT